MEYFVGQDEVSAKPATLERKYIQSTKPGLVWQRSHTVDHTCGQARGGVLETSAFLNRSPIGCQAASLQLAQCTFADIRPMPEQGGRSLDAPCTEADRLLG